MHDGRNWKAKGPAGLKRCKLKVNSQQAAKDLCLCRQRREFGQQCFVETHLMRQRKLGAAGGEIKDVNRGFPFRFDDGDFDVALFARKTELMRCRSPGWSCATISTSVLCAEHVSSIFTRVSTLIFGAGFFLRARGRAAFCRDRLCPSTRHECWFGSAPIPASSARACENGR